MKGYEKASEKTLILYWHTLQPNSTDEIVLEYKKYCNMYNRLKHTSMKEFYTTKVTECKKNTKKLWKIINQVTK